MSDSLPRAHPDEPATPVIEPAAPETDVLVQEDDGHRSDHPWRVILFNDETHTFRAVIRQLVKATGCTAQHAEEKAWEVHSTGKANVYEGEFEECFKVQAVLKEIQLVTEIEG